MAALLLCASDDPVLRGAAERLGLAFGVSAPFRFAEAMRALRPQLAVWGTEPLTPAVVRARRELGVYLVGRAEPTDETRLLSLLPTDEGGFDEVWPTTLALDAAMARATRALDLANRATNTALLERKTRALLELTQALTSALELSDILFTVVQRIAEVVQTDRVSIVLVPHEANGTGHVVAASDDQAITNLRIDLEKYPEILEVLRTRSPLVIHDVQTHPLLDGVRRDVPPSTLALVPIVWQDETMGVLFLRGKLARGALETHELEFCSTVANAMAIALRNARLLKNLRSEKQEVTVARVEAERRVVSLQRYADFFVSSSEGLVVLDRDGRPLFANPRARVALGLGQAPLAEGSLLPLLDDAERRPVLTAFRQARDGATVHGIDITLRRRSPNETRILSCSFTPLKESEGAVLISGRDVTNERETAAELSKTKEFLESLIQASVDAIIAADLRGKILLFNRGAERITGWGADEVIGKLNVRELYPDDGALEVMRRLRATAHGGRGRLEATRMDVQDRMGRRVPVQLSAAVMEDGQGRRFGTVGIFTDLREKLRIEMRLNEAQEKLALSEKQALVAELAGTAAHELNQPLTSILAYAQLLLRKSSPERPEYHAATVIVQQAERMADMVKKIGKITHYETKSYVGGARILDLDRASDERATETTKP